MLRHTGPTLLVCFVLAAACGGGASRTPTAAPSTVPPDQPPTISAPSPTQFPQFSVALTKCAQGDGWVRPSGEEQRAHLRMLGGAYARASAERDPIAGEYVSRDGREPTHWEYIIFWPFLNTPENRDYAVASSGLWTAIPDASGLRCSLDPRHIVVLVLDNEILSVHGEDRYTQVFEMVARPKPGHFEFIEMDAPSGDRPAGFDVVDEAGKGIVNCCM